MATTLSPYLNFDGKTREAMEFYHSILGGELYIQTFGEAFPETPDHLKNRIMHASLTHDAIHIMASDTHPEHSPPFVQGNNYHLCLGGTDANQQRDTFAKLAEGGNVVMPLEKQFWGDEFGSLIDKFGVQWMVNISQE